MKEIIDAFIDGFLSGGLIDCVGISVMMLYVSKHDKKEPEPTFSNIALAILVPLFLGAIFALVKVIKMLGLC